MLKPIERRSPLAQWLKWQGGRDDATGRLARMVTGDAELFRVVSKTYDRHVFIEVVRNSPRRELYDIGPIEAARNAWAEYEAARNAWAINTRSSQ